MARQAGEKFDAREFEKYMRRYDRTAYGAGSEKKDPVDRFSGLDVRKMFQAGRDMGGSQAEVAQDVLDYAADFGDISRMGGGTRDALEKLRGYLDDEPVKKVKVKSGDDDGIPVPFPVREEEATYAPFRGSYFDFVGGDPSNPADYYMGDPERGGATRYFGESVIEDGSPAGVVPGDQPSFARMIQDPSYFESFGYEDGGKGYETEEDRVTREVAGGLPTIVNMFRDRAVGGVVGDALGGNLVGGLVGRIV